MKGWPLAAVLGMWAAGAFAVTVQDDAGKAVTMTQPARRIVSLAPHTTELLFAAGAGERIVGTVDYSDYPAAARAIPRVGNHQQLDIERILALKPDLLVVWLHGGAERQLEQLQRLGIPFYFSEPRRLADIPDGVERLGRLTGTEKQAMQNAAAQRAELARLAARYRDRPPVRAFYQVWGRPVYTLNGQHIVSDMLQLCGAQNVFGNLNVTAPMVSIESVLLANPEVMINGERRDESTPGLEIWRGYPMLEAIRKGNLFAIDADLLSRSGPRLIEGAAVVCEKIEQARERRKVQ